MSHKRLTSNYREGTGDSGYSLLNAAEGRISKGSFYPIFFGTLDSFQHDLSTYLNNQTYLEDKLETLDLDFFNYLLQLSFSINAFAYSVGEDDPKSEVPNWCEKQLPKKDAFDFLEDRINYYKQKALSIYDVKEHEFIIPSGNINIFRLKIRSLEQALWALRDQRRQVFFNLISTAMVNADKYAKDQSEAISLLTKWKVANDRFRYLGSFLNRLSSYFFHLMKYQLVKELLPSQDLAQWRSEAPNFYASSN